MKNYVKEQLTFSTTQMATVGVLVALYVIINRFCSINVWNLSIGLTFIPLAVAAILMGPLKAGLVGGLGDFIGAIIFPFGPYFPGFTLTAFLKGIVFGVALYKKASFVRILSSSAIVEFVLSLFLQSFWIFYLYGAKTYPAIVASRLIQVVPLFILELVVITIISKTLIERLEPFFQLDKKKAI